MSLTGAHLVESKNLSFTVEDVRNVTSSCKACAELTIFQADRRATFDKGYSTIQTDQHGF